MDPKLFAQIVPVITLLGLVLLLLAGWWLFPWFLHVMKHQDCIGSGRVDC